jgi:Histidine kinase-, DNA gyrase B-, and HSP90-like ATPase
VQRAARRANAGGQGGSLRYWSFGGIAVKLLLVEDDKKIATAVKRGLEAEGFSVEVAFDGDDDGPGIPVDQHDRVFERFARLDGARSATAGGTGLGLAIAREIVQRHHGSIAIDPEHHPGTRFVVILPRDSPRPPLRRPFQRPRCTTAPGLKLRVPGWKDEEPGRG